MYVQVCVHNGGWGRAPIKFPHSALKQLNANYVSVRGLTAF